MAIGRARSRMHVCQMQPSLQAAAIATWALVCTRGDVLVGVAALQSRATLRFRMCSCLADSVIVLVGVMLLSTLGTNGCPSMERVIRLVSLV